MIHELGLLQPPNQIAFDVESSAALAEKVGFPLVVRPSYVLGGRAMEIVYDQDDLARYMTEAVKVTRDSPVLLDRFLDEAVEVDVDAICDGDNVFIGGLMEHIEQAGVHSGDSACSLPPYTLSESIQQRMCEQVTTMARALNVVGLMNTQFAIKGEEIYILEVNPRASRTVPFVSKATGVALAKIAARCMVGQSLTQQGYKEQVIPDFVAVKESVFPFTKFQGVDPILGPEMKSTGEVMGIGRSFAEAFAKGMIASGSRIPDPGTAFLSVRETDKKSVSDLARELHQQGFKLVATGGTAKVIQQAGVDCKHVNKVKEGRPHVVDMIKNDEIALIVNTTEGRSAIADSYTIRREALMHSVCYTTTLSGGWATCQAMSHRQVEEVYCLQSLY
jgi:carbamoyl-phosphate synthase large subunit